MIVNLSEPALSLTNWNGLSFAVEKTADSALTKKYNSSGIDPNGKFASRLLTL